MAIAVVLARNPRADEAFADYRVSPPALLPVGRESVLLRMLRALHGTVAVRAIAVVGPARLLQAHSMGAHLIDSDDPFWPAVLALWARRARDEIVLGVGASLPFLAPHAVEAFLQVATMRRSRRTFATIQYDELKRAYPIFAAHREPASQVAPAVAFALPPSPDEWYAASDFVSHGWYRDPALAIALAGVPALAEWGVSLRSPGDYESALEIERNGRRLRRSAIR